MKALTRLQSTVIFQASGVEGVSERFCERARNLVAFGVVLAAALSSNPAHAQSGPMSPSACAALGGTVGGLVGSQVGNDSVKHTIGAVLGAFGGAVAGNYLCAPMERSKDSSYDRAATYGVSAESVAVERQAPKMSLSINERERLDEMSREAIDAKYQWKKSLLDIDNARQRNFSGGINAGMERESEARHNFELKREAFARTVARLNNGSEGMPPRAVGRYLEISAALLELTTESKVSFQMLEQRDRAMQERSEVYHQEADRAAAMRNRNS